MLQTKNKGAAWGLGLGLPVLVLGALAAVLIPVWLIQPFKAQTQSGIELSFFLRRWSPVLTLLVAGLALACAVWLWRGARWWSRVFLALACVVAIGGAWLARQNHFEWMFKPLPNAAYAKVSEANFVNDNDMVLAVEINGEAVAYPVRQMAYHHVVNDVVGGKPITATY